MDTVTHHLVKVPLLDPLLYFSHTCHKTFLLTALAYVQRLTLPRLISDCWTICDDVQSIWFFHGNWVRCVGMATKSIPWLLRMKGGSVGRLLAAGIGFEARSDDVGGGVDLVPLHCD